MKTSELTGTALDWAVGVANDQLLVFKGQPFVRYSTDWAQGGPLIEKECIALAFDGFPQGWVANQKIYGPTPLIAAMRCYVASKLGDEVEIPEELKTLRPAQANPSEAPLKKPRNNMSCGM